MLRLSVRNPAPRAVEDEALLSALVRGYGKLVLAPNELRARTFAGQIERLAQEVEAMSDDTGYLARARERLEVEVETFAQEQRDDVAQTIEMLEQGLRMSTSRLQDTLHAGDTASEAMLAAREGLCALDKVTSFAELRAGLDAEIQRLDEAVQLHARMTTEARDGMRGEISHLQDRLEEARELACRDALTGLANRSEFDRRLATLRFPERHVVAVIDLDGFKPINDRHGHSAGDYLLVQFAHRLTQTMGRIGMVARIGGDEFAVLFEGSEAHLMTRLRTLELSLTGTPVTRGELVLPLGMSFGTAPLEKENPSRALGVADGRMYLYKREKGVQRAA